MVFMIQGIKRMLSLTSIIVRTVDTGISFGRKQNKVKKKGMGIAGILILSFVFLYFGALILFLSNSLYELLAPLHFEMSILGLATAVFSFIIFFFGIFYIISVFYFTKDIEQLLALPFRAWEIIGAKFLSVIIFEYITSSLVLIPYFVYGVKSGTGFLFYLYAILIFLLMPVIPLAITAVIIMPVMRFVKFARNKDLFNTVAGVLVLILVFGGNMFLSQTVMKGELSAGVAGIIKGGGEKISSMTSMIFPGTWFAGQSLGHSNDVMGFLYLLLFALSVALAFGLVLLLANYLYIKAATAVSSSNASHKRLNMTEISKSSTPKSAFFTYMVKDFLILVRTPIYLMNNVIMNFIWPFLLLFVSFMNQKNSNSGGLIRSLLKGFDYSDTATMGIFILFVFAGAILIGGSNGIASSALSREGSCFELMKYVPMSYFSQIMAKVMVGYSFSLIGVLCGVIVLSVIAAPPLWFVLLCIAIILPAALFPNVTGIIYELFWPKLHWDNEQKAVKQNLNVLLGMFIPLALVALVVAGGIYWKWNLWLAFFILFFGSILLDVVTIVVLKRMIPNRMQKINY